jgi:DNA-binding protein H-NS
MQSITTISLDIAKSVFHVHRVDAEGKIFTVNHSDKFCTRQASILRKKSLRLARFRLPLFNLSLCEDPMQPKKSSLTTLSNDALCKLRDEIAALLNSRAQDLRRELDQLTGGAVAHGGKTNDAANASKAELKKIAPKYRGPDGATWAGRGLKPRWLTSALKEGKKLEDFLIVAYEREIRGSVQNLSHI